MNQIHLSTKNISVEFPGVKALSNVDFCTDTGAIHAVVGANGAGKTTLMKVLTGVETSYTGSIYLDNESINIRSPHDAQKLGIQIVHQEVDSTLIPAFSVAENIMLNEMVNMMGKKQFIDWDYIYKEAGKKLKRLNVQIDVRKKASELSLAQKQMVIISRAIMSEIKFLILDEPTSALSNTETNELFRVIKELAAHNVGIIFITHRLPEVFEICDEITIMRDGKIITNQKINQMNFKKVVEIMLGRKFGDAYPKEENKFGKVVLEVKNLTSSNKEIQDINLYVRSGEIVGIAGLVGAGKSELCRSLFGDLKVVEGEIFLNGKKIISRTPSKAVKSGLALIPEERRKQGIVLDEPIFSNLSITSLTKFCNRMGFIYKKKERNAAKNLIKKLGIATPNETRKVGFLSGGNQQKVSVGKWLTAKAGVFIFDEPTKGVDVGAKQDIYRLIEALASEGKAIIYATCEHSELIGISDRIYVMYKNKIVAELVTKNTSEKEILFLSTGGNKGE